VEWCREGGRGKGEGGGGGLVSRVFVQTKNNKEVRTKKSKLLSLLFIYVDMYK
jgi:hypothetical protein